MKVLSLQAAKPVIRNKLFFISLISCFLLISEWNVIANSPQKSGTDFSIYYRTASNFKLDASSLYAQSNPGFDQYLYPPPSLIIFLVLSGLEEHVAFLVFITFMYVCLIASFIIWGQACRNVGIKTTFNHILLFIIFILASGPAYHNIRLGQVNALVLLASVLYLYLYKEKPFIAGLFLALAIWIKVYPVFLLLLAITSTPGRKSIIGCIAGGVLLPVVLLPWIPLSLYKSFLLKLIDVTSYASMHMINHSLIAFILRFTLPFEWAFKWPNVYTIPGWLKLVNYIVLAGVVTISYFVISSFKNKTLRNKGELIFGSILLSLGAMFSPLGWGHTFILATPLLFIAFHFIELNHKPWLAWLSILFISLLYLIPVYNDKLFRTSWPLLVSNMYYSRFLLITLFTVLVLWLELRSKKI